ncbi:ABC transporter permease subunit [Microtetraspora malaysiensis]|uniref:ABC transporter permease subunit n=1 Tax=Microtetraspora malaysiensis TaxID=161358 RepID=UPI00082E13AA|nr:ABC transporter permease subunit [Microtetraspora malaysiensis]
MSAGTAPSRGGFRRLLRAEWTKFRTVRGWVLGLAIAPLVIVTLGLVAASGSHTSCGGPTDVCPATPVGPGGEAVDDRFYFVHRSLTGDGGITARVSSMTGHIRKPDVTQGARNVVDGVVPWAKAGVMVKDGTRQGSAYAATMVTGGHGVRMQYDFTQDIAGRPGGVSNGSPRWLRLTRAGDELTGYESADGRHWTVVGTARPAGLPDTVQVGFFVASPGDLTVQQADFGGSIQQSRFTEAIADFDQVAVEGETSGGAWERDDIGVTMEPDGSTPHHPGGFAQSGDTYTVTGVGDIAPLGDGQRIESTLSGLPAGLVGVIVVAVMFVTAEYRRGLIRTSLLAGPRRGRVLAAKATVIGTVTFVAGSAAAGITVVVGTRILRSNGNPVLPVNTFTELRVIAGVAALAAVSAVLAFALGALFRNSAAAVTAAVAVIIVPHVLATTSVLPVGAAQWLLRLTPAAGFAVQQSIPEYPHVISYYAPSAGYYPLAPWAGLSVLCAYAALALGLAVVRIRRRDA